MKAGIVNLQYVSPIYRWLWARLGYKYSAVLHKSINIMILWHNLKLIVDIPTSTLGDFYCEYEGENDCMQHHHNVVNFYFFKFLNGYPIARLLGQSMGCLLLSANSDLCNTWATVELNEISCDIEARYSGIQLYIETSLKLSNTSSSNSGQVGHIAISLAFKDFLIRRLKRKTSCLSCHMSLCSRWCVQSRRHTGHLSSLLTTLDLGLKIQQPVDNWALKTWSHIIYINSKYMIQDKIIKIFVCSIKIPTVIKDNSHSTSHELCTQFMLCCDWLLP